MLRRALWVAGLGVWQLMGCAAGGAGGVSSGDGGPDASRAADGRADAPPDADSAPDASADAPVARPDGAAGPEGGRDGNMPILDASSPGDARSSPDAGSSCPDTIETLRSATGPVDLTVCGVVTYVYDAGFFLQAADVDGPAIQAYEGPGFSPDGFAEGDRVRLRVTEVGDFFGAVQVRAHDPVERQGDGGEPDAWVQDLTGGSVPGEALEAELVRVGGAEVTAVDGPRLTISYGTATDVELRVSDATPFCVGATFDVIGVVIEHEGVHRIESFRAEDVEALDLEGCPGGEGRAPVPGDLLLNEFLADPATGVSGDANCDGTRDAEDDEFVEIVNVSGETIALDGVTISDGGEARHVFATRTDLVPGKAAVVFGGGSPSCAWEADVLALAATSGRLSLNNDGDTIAITGSSAGPLLSLTYGTEAEQDESRTLEPDLDDEDPASDAVSGYVGHSSADTADMSPFSPGTHIDGSPF